MAKIKHAFSNGSFFDATFFTEPNFVIKLLYKGTMQKKIFDCSF